MKTPGIPDCCSGSAWALAAHDTLRSPEHRLIPPLIAHEDGHWLLFAQRPGHQGIYYFEPFEGHWLFTCPLVGPDPEQSLNLLHKAVRRLSSQYPCCFLIGGVPAEDRLQALIESQADGYRVVQKASGIPSMWIHLSGGMDAYLSRRTAAFRKSIRQAMRRSADAELQISSDNSDPGQVLDRLLRIEQRCWKYQHNQSIFQELQFVEFYSHLIHSSHKTGDLRFLVATIENQDVGYILGGCFGDTYRGWQMSFDEEYKHLSVGNILQIENMRRCAEEGVSIYDLGMFADYKVRWTDEVRDLSIFVILFPSSS